VAAAEARALAARLRQLTPPESSEHNLAEVTKAQLARRGHEVAKARAKHPVAQAIVASKWGSVDAYARKRLRIAQGTLSKYIAGKLETPAEVADRVFEDFGLADGVWNSPPTRRR